MRPGLRIKYYVSFTGDFLSGASAFLIKLPWLNCSPHYSPGANYQELIPTQVALLILVAFIFYFPAEV
jgi:hypothetical protein